MCPSTQGLSLYSKSQDFLLACLIVSILDESEGINIKKQSVGGINHDFQLSYLKTMSQPLRGLFCFHYNFDLLCSLETKKERLTSVSVEQGFEEILSFRNLP